MKWANGFCKILILCEIFLFLFASCSCSGEVFSEKEILIEFKESISDPSGILSSWILNSSDHHCSWYGVTCDSKFKVISVKLSGGDSGERGNINSQAISCSSQFPYHGFGIRRYCSHANGKLVGKLSPLIGKLTELRVLSLPFNDFSGEIPVSIWDLENLKVLDLEGNRFVGKLPSHFKGLRKLKVLNIRFSKIVGEIPLLLSKCVSLRVLDLAGNGVSGNISDLVGRFGNNCVNLEHLDLSGNSLNGEIPPNLGNCRRLRTVLLFSNHFGGVVPRELGRLTRLEVLDVSRNNLSGLIPAELGNCVNLSVIVLSNLFDPLSVRRLPTGEAMLRPAPDYNYFQGSVPVEITTLPKLKMFWAPSAMLEGKFPRNWGSCDNLKVVNLAENYFVGEMKGVFGQCNNLLYLNLRSNRLTGELDDELPVPCMTAFDISGNIMSGIIPSFSHIICPRRLALNADHLQFGGPSFAYISFFAFQNSFHTSLSMFGARFVIIHSFGGNNFTGSIPQLPFVPGQLRKQVDYAFLAGGNKLNGTIPRNFFHNCNGFNGVIANFSNNRISGQIPSDFSAACRSLTLLDFSRNKLQGQIPDVFGLLNKIRYLSFASNNLTGVIPSSFGLLRSLEVLKLSSNSLSGDIPQSLVNLRNLTVLQLNNNKFSGEIPSGLDSMTSLSAFNVSFNNLSVTLSKRNLVKCSDVLGNPLPRSCHVHFLFETASESVDIQADSLNNAGTPSGSVTAAGKSRINSIEIASIVSASAIVSVLMALIVLFFYTRKWVPNSRVQVSVSREIILFSDFGVPLTFENLVQATGNFSASNCIGYGGFGATYRADISPEVTVAVKRLSAGRFQGVEQFRAEIKTLERVRHPNLVTLIGYHASEAEMFLIYNYLPGGNLEKFIQERSPVAADWKTVHKIALDIAHALAYLHDQCVPKVLHRDVKPSNILLDNNSNAYLSDFGLSRLLETSATHATTGVAGTFGYVAPEYAITCRVSEKADVYSYGVVLLELISDKKALDPSFSSHDNGFNIVSWAHMLLRDGHAKDVFNERLWNSGPQDKLVDTLHLAVRCTIETLSIRPTMKHVVQQLKRLRPHSASS